ncbi:MAG TPA: hypothetical protein VNI84_06390 [Pyrinomonadaceae bacterium]|nr:hypothetical protein [Pyrinomonadaceae bacterium]
MNFLKTIAFAAAFLTSTFLTSALPVQEKFVELSPVNSKQVSETVINAAAEKFFYKLSDDEYFLNRYYSAVEENPAAAEKSNLFEFETADLNGDGRVELFVNNHNLSISANYLTVVYSIEDNNLREILESDGVFYVSTAPAGNYKTIRTVRHESAIEHSAVEFTYNAVVGVYQQSTKPELITKSK